MRGPAVSLIVTVLLGGLALLLGIANPNVALWSAALTVVAVAQAAVAVALMVHERRTDLAVYHAAEALDEAARSGVIPVIQRENMNLRLVPLYRSLHRFARRQREQILALDLAAMQHRTVLEALRGALIVLDGNERVLQLNRAAEQFIIPGAVAVGARAVDCIGFSQLRDLIESYRGRGTAQEVELATADDPPRYWMAYITPLADGKGEVHQHLVVLTDVTRLKRLETLRRDFVANVSHELKTPVTSIAASVETLLDGALSNPDDARRFVEVIGRQTERLTAIFDDLLRLSHIELAHEQASVVRQCHSLAPLLHGAREMCSDKARSKGSAIEIECDGNLVAYVNGNLLQQAVVNLIDNAIKYSKPNDLIIVRGEASGSGVKVAVSDTGVGIAPEHLPRLFERFYRADPARSRSEGGTGLGLAIVKHIAQAHGGSVAVNSRVGSGSTFTIEIPGP